MMLKPACSITYKLVDLLLVKNISTNHHSLHVPYRVAGHPLAQNEKCLHMFIQEPVIDKNYVPGKIRNT